MALFYSGRLQELPKITLTDVHRLAKTSSKSPISKLDKGFKLRPVTFSTMKVVLKPSEPVTMTQHHHTDALLFQSAHYSKMGTPVDDCTAAQRPSSSGISQGLWVCNLGP